MKNTAVGRWALCFYILTWVSSTSAWPDGGYFSRSVAVSADQRAIIIKNGNEISMTFSTGYTGEGDGFGWIIPTPVPPAIGDVSEAGEKGKAAFKLLDAYSAPRFVTGGGCFPAGTQVLTASGPRAIETVEPGAKTQTCDLATGEWTLASVLKRQSLHYEGDMVTIHVGAVAIQATGNHPFFVVSGDRLGSRPLPQDVPPEEQVATERGRWVEARDLKAGDMLKARSSEGLIITSLSSRQERIVVYNLDVEGHHNYAVHQAGILVHNKAGAPEKAAPVAPVTVYGRVTLEHYEVSILGAAGVTPLLAWLQRNGYPVYPAAQKVLDSYIQQNWAFVAVKLKPGEKRHYENEFLPPLTTRYRHDRLIFPLHISSVSTTQTARITLYVIAESTVSSPNFPTATLKYEGSLSKPVDPEQYIESRIQKTLAGEGRTLVLIRSGEISKETAGQALASLMKSPFPESTKMYLTRLEARMDAAAMSDDIRFMLDPTPAEFHVEIRPLAGSPHSSFDKVMVDSGGSVYATGHIVGTATYDFAEGVAATGTSYDNLVLVKYNSLGMPQWARTGTIVGSTFYPRFSSVVVIAGGTLYAAGSIAGTETHRLPEGARATGSSSGYYSSFYSVAVDAGGSMYLAGGMAGTGTFDFGWGITATGTSKRSNLALAKYESSGRTQWARTVTAVGDTSSSSFSSVTVDAGGSVYAAGEITGTETFDFGGGVTATGTYKGGNPVLVKYSSSGKAQWARTVTTVGGTSYSNFSSVTVDSGGTVYAAGSITGTGTFDFGGGVTTRGDSTNRNAVLVKYDASGVPQWVLAATGGSDSDFSSVVTDAGGNVYAVGHITGTQTFHFGGGLTATAGPNNRTPVLVKYSPSGVPLWVRTVTASSDSWFPSVAVDASGSVYAAGAVSDKGTFDFGGGVMITVGYGSGVLVKYDSSGRAQWARTVAVVLD